MILEHQISFDAHSAPLYALSKGPNGTFFSGGADNVVGNWSLHELKPQNLTLKTENSIFSLNYSEARNMLFIGSSTNHFHWIDLKKKEEIKNYHVHTKGIFGTCFIDDQFMLSYGGEGSIVLWDLENYTMVRQVPLAEAKIRNAQTHLNDLAVACGDGLVHILDKHSLNEKYTLDAHERSTNALLYNKNHLVTGGWDGHLKLWDEEYNLIKSIPAHNYAIYGLAQLSSAYFASVSKDKTIKIWSNSLEPIERYDFKKKGHSRSINRCLVMDGFFVSAGDDGKIIVWKIND